MKIVLNRQCGGFNLPEGFKILYKINSYEEEWQVARTDERLIHYVELNGGEQPYGLLKVVEVPDTCTDWELDEYDGFESITYVVNGKIYHI